MQVPLLHLIQLRTSLKLTARSKFTSYWFFAGPFLIALVRMLKSSASMFPSPFRSPGRHRIMDRPLIGAEPSVSITISPESVVMKTTVLPSKPVVY